MQKDGLRPRAKRIKTRKAAPRKKKNSADSKQSRRQDPQEEEFGKRENSRGHQWVKGRGLWDQTSRLFRAGKDKGEPTDSKTAG